MTISERYRLLDRIYGERSWLKRDKAYALHDWLVFPIRESFSLDLVRDYIENLEWSEQCLYHWGSFLDLNLTTMSMQADARTVSYDIRYLNDSGNKYVVIEISIYEGGMSGREFLEGALFGTLPVAGTAIRIFPVEEIDFEAFAKAIGERANTRCICHSVYDKYPTSVFAQIYFLEVRGSVSTFFRKFDEVADLNIQENELITILELYGRSLGYKKPSWWDTLWYNAKVWFRRWKYGCNTISLRYTDVAHDRYIRFEEVVYGRFRD